MDQYRVYRLLPSSWTALDPIIEASVREGFRFLARLREEYAAGDNRFARRGEVLLGVYQGQELIAVGGLNRDPYGGVARTGRLRHVYVLPAWRRRGVGRVLVQALLRHAESHFSQIVLRTDTCAAARFYEALGFVPEGRIEGATHRLSGMRMDGASRGS